MIGGDTGDLKDGGFTEDWQHKMLTVSQRKLRTYHSVSEQSLTGDIEYKQSTVWYVQVYLFSGRWERGFLQQKVT